MNRLMSALGLGIFLLAAADGSSAFAECKPGTPHCIPSNLSIPKFCGTPGGKACTIYGGLGSTCKGGGTCGTGPQGPPGNPYFPYGNDFHSSSSTPPPSLTTAGATAGFATGNFVSTSAGGGSFGGAHLAAPSRAATQRR